MGFTQKYPNSPGLESIVWRENGLATGGQSEINWTMNYGVAITNFEGSNVTASQIVSGKLGNTYQVIIKDGITGIDSSPIASDGPASIVKLQNNTAPAKKVDMGFSLDGDIITAQKDVGGKQASNYEVHPTYYVALFRNVKVGDLVTSDVTTAPQIIEYKQGNIPCYSHSLYRCRQHSDQVRILPLNSLFYWNGYGQLKFVDFLLAKYLLSTVVVFGGFLFVCLIFTITKKPSKSQLKTSRQVKMQCNHVKVANWKKVTPNHKIILVP